ncbi:fibroblast growth factor receptor-like 1 [Caerostris extrusa]|uniref:Fibroblast growth factor receptor-like 1 n=1 Tax=Caerostris extrusa TaxID=172846 RepID=A0AAV4SK60_CAEEX|nr:fibroblast growth factor receptor-like 1 [Caerostris extrusa]
MGSRVHIFISKEEENRYGSRDLLPIYLKAAVSTRRKIRGKPLITGFNTTVLEGQKAVMECGVESASHPHIEWLKQVNVDPATTDPGKHAISMKGEYFNV